MNDGKNIFQYEGIPVSDLTSTTKDLSATIGDKAGTTFSSSETSSKISTEDGTTIGKNPNAVHVKRYIFYLKKG